MEQIFLQGALNNPLWLSHKIGDTYTLDKAPLLIWRIGYYPIFEDGKTNEPYSESRALIERPTLFGNEWGTDFREVPLRYLTRNKEL